MWAFALASFMTGVAGCLLAAQIGQPTAQSIQTQDSITLLATVMIGGIFSLWGAVVAGVFFQLRPVPLPGAVGHQPELPPILFGVGLLQVLLTAPGGLVAAAAEGPREPGAPDRRLFRKGAGRRGQST